MTVLESTGKEENGVTEPIRFPGTKDERREERIRRRLERARVNYPDENDMPIPALDPDEVVRQPAPAVEEPKQRAHTLSSIRRSGLSWTFISFLLMVGIPGALTGIYFAFIASPQYVVETQFSVRGSSQSSISSFGLSGLFGSSVQSNDSYIVSSYVESVQLVRDVKEQLGIDLRQYYSKNNIDFYYRIDPNMPLEKFTSYWQSMIEVSFNSTTGNTTLYIYGFSPDDSKAIADAVLKVSETLVNNLSEASRQQMTAVASRQVERAEGRLKKVRDEIRQLRVDQQTIDPTVLTKIEGSLQQSLQSQLSGIQTRYNTVLQSVDKDSPSARILKKQITALEEQLAAQREKISDHGVQKAGRVKAGQEDSNIAGVLNKFEELTVEQGFATQAYTTSLAAFETALAEAQKQERYFATFVSPTRPEIALYPMRLLDSFIAFLVLLAVWMISQFLYRSFRDHAI